MAKISFLSLPRLALGPTQLTFGPQHVGTASTSQTVTLLDAGSQPLNITSIVASGDFAQTNTCGSAVPPGTACALSVTFTPKATGTRSGVVTITDNSAGSPYEVLLTGTGGAPAMQVTPTSLTFAGQAVGTASTPQSATLKNTGDGPLDINGIGSQPNVFAVTNNCVGTLQPRASCTISVSFKPTTTGTISGWVLISDNLPFSPQGPLFLTGTGVAPGPWATLTPPDLFFGNQLVGTFSPAQLTTLKNTGGGTLKITSIGRSGDFYEGNNCPATLAAGASCTLRVVFTPTSPGTKSSAVTIADNAPGSPHKLPLTGTGSGTGSIILNLSPASLTFGSVAVGSTSSPQTVTLTNTGTVAASFRDPFGFATQGADWRVFAKNPHCGTSLAPSKSCTVTVTFTPTAVGTRTGSFVVRQGAASKQIPLSGTGTAGP